MADFYRDRMPTAAGSAAQAAIDEGLRAYMLRIYNFMAVGLAVSGVVAYLVYSVPSLQAMFFAVNEMGYVQGFSGLGYVALFAPLGILLWMNFGVRSMSGATMQALYWAFVALQGVGLSVLLMVYTEASIVRTFFVTAAAFGGLSLYGYTTRRSLSGMGSFMVMGLFGLVIASIVNIFLGSSQLQWVMSVAGVVIFSGLIAWDTQRLKETYMEGLGHESATKMAVLGAISLYLDFINLFRFLLYFMGAQRE
ncbi:Bax inhibitor-1/YccA family protein [Zavarzinia sp. CC-PAN008]|uniref:Bax inhibitor-1/YccA family protein n=1 Tax=Zavarzinia sp. CC-PAN008 TaxID=3243332 RepID=UPI003F74992B